MEGEPESGKHHDFDGAEGCHLQPAQLRQGETQEKSSIQEECTMLNEYENEAFFQQYAEMSRSREGLSAAGEWHPLQPLFPPPEGTSALALGRG